jgi:hypothetical protein
MTICLGSEIKTFLDVRKLRESLDSQPNCSKVISLRVSSYRKETKPGVKLAYQG